MKGLWEGSAHLVAKILPAKPLADNQRSETMVVMANESKYPKSKTKKVKK